MNSDAITESNYPQVPSGHFRDKAPETVSIPFLLLNTQRVLDNSDAPFPFEVRPLSENFLKEILGEPTFCHRVEA